jgi:hypothetical protein
MRRLIMAAFCLCVFAAVPSIAEAAVPHWKWGNPAAEIPQGTPVSIETSGKLTFTISSTASKKPTKIKCAVQDREMIENPIGGGPGNDKMSSFILSGCTGKAVCSTGTTMELGAAGLPWGSELIAGTPPSDEIKNVEINTLCGGLVGSTFKGTLSPTIVGWGGLKFGPGTLIDGFGNTMTVKGTDKLKGPPPKSKIGVI